jgi:hypothetical protein
LIGLNLVLGSRLAPISSDVRHTYTQTCMHAYMMHTHTHMYIHA